MTENSKELTSWTELMENRNYPIPDGLTDFDFGLQTELNDIKNKQYLADSKNKNFLNKRSTALCLTIHKPWQYYKTPNDLINIIKQLNDVVDYYCFSLEIGSGTTFHIQGYIRFQYAKRMRYKALLKLFQTTEINFEEAKGTAAENLTYISKSEDEKINKWMVTFGDFTNTVANRKNFTASEYVDYCIKNGILINDQTMDLYCSDYRKNPEKAKSTVTLLYNARILAFKRNNQILQHLTFSGNSGSGKSLVTDYLLNRIDARIGRDVVKMEANKGKERLWFNKDASLKPICWFSEMTWYFPNKTHLLSLLDRQSYLDVKGKDSVPNLFDVLLLNSTSITPYTIYNISQNANVSYVEIARRLFDYGKLYFVFPNEEWNKIPFTKRQKLLNDDDQTILEKYTPRIFEVVDDTFPARQNLRLTLPNNHKSELQTEIVLTANDTVTEKIMIKDITANNGYEDYTQTATINYAVKPVTLEAVYDYFIEVLKSVNSPLLKQYLNKQEQSKSTSSEAN